MNLAGMTRSASVKSQRIERTNNQAINHGRSMQTDKRTKQIIIFMNKE
jgi:hypothetical protein